MKRTFFLSCYHWYFLAALLLALPPAVKVQADIKQGLDYFEGKVRPLLVAECYACHSAAAAAKGKLKGELMLDTREGMRKGGKSGPVLVPGKPEESLILKALRHSSEDLKMPPKKKLPDELIGHLAKWIGMGAPDPRKGTQTDTAGMSIEDGRAFWSMRPLSAASPPQVKNPGDVRTPVDHFVRARQEAAGLAQNPAATPRTLIRRAYFDLWGIPPDPEEVETFVAEAEKDLPGAWARQVDRLLESPHYGERWARHWLDLVRFAESNGYAFDQDRANAYRYRNFVIDAFNEDMPYDEFVRLQIAGDLLTKTDVQTVAEAQAAVPRIAATGFLVAGPFTTQQTMKERERSRYEQLDDMIHTMGVSMLGMSVGCARCHSHKYDPIPMEDYYHLAATFADVGFADVGVEQQPEVYRKARDTFDAALKPLADAQAAFDKEKLPARFEAWLATIEQAPAESGEYTAGDWQHIGPFATDDFAKTFEQVFEPEKAIDLAASYQEGALKWVPQPDWKDATVHNTFSTANAANYLYRVIETKEALAFELSLGSDDGIKCWLNGEQVLSNMIGRGVEPDQEHLRLNLKKGRNEFLMKIVNGGGQSGFYYSALAIPKPSLPAMGPWQYIGPFSANDFNKTFDEAFPPESEIKLEQTYLEGAVKWTAQPDWSDAVAHNDKFTGDKTAHYLYRSIDAKVARNLILDLGSDDGIKLWVNGEELLSHKLGRDNAKAGQEQVVVQLKAGHNDLLMKIVNNTKTSGFYFAAEATFDHTLPSLGTWRHIGPFSGSDFNAVFDEIYPPERGVALDQTYEDGNVTWTEQPDWADGIAHNDKFKDDKSAQYLFREVHAEKPTVLQLSLGSDDGIKLWVNGRIALNKKVGRNIAAAGQERATIQLAPGRNEILMKIVNNGGDSGFYFLARPGVMPADVATIVRSPSDKWNDGQRNKAVDWYKGFEAEWLSLSQSVLQHKTTEPKPDLAMAYAAKVNGTSYGFGEDSFKVYNLRRGNPANKESLAEPGLMQVLMRPWTTEEKWTQAPAAEKPPPSRVSLASWLTDPRDGAGNLLARVVVNRLWQHHFGRGIVATPDDFGSRGDRPTHPELLDWLATELIQNGWQLKPIHRLIMNSSVYLQTNEITETHRSKDPDNALWAHRNTLRIEAEAIRDSLLAISGQLDRTRHEKGTLDVKNPRRSIYLTVKRSQLTPMLQLFDAPAAIQAIGQRMESTVAPQALTLMNGPLLQEWAGKFAARARPDATTPLPEAIDRAFRMAFSRPASPEEIQTFTAYIEAQKALPGGSEDKAFRNACHALLCANELIYID